MAEYKEIVLDIGERQLWQVNKQGILLLPGE